jgi:hypothetical protein
MDLSKYKSVKKGSAKKVAEIFKATRNKLPSDRLVKIISEVGEPSEEKQKRPLDRVAKQAEI